MVKAKHWFEDWFDSPFYHILYGNRDESEANRFINNLIGYLNPASGSFFLDLACGKGRHALAIHNKGFAVHGMDLSKNSIALAKTYEDHGLTFSEGDMRNIYAENTYNYVFNLFTSFGYFNHFQDHDKTLQSIHSQLTKNGILVIDYVNVVKAEVEIGSGIKNKISRKGIVFNIHKYLSENQINKSIQFKVNQKQFEFKEHIWRLDMEAFNRLFEENGFVVQTIFGDYELEEFNPQLSDRLIIVAQKL